MITKYNLWMPFSTFAAGDSSIVFVMCHLYINLRRSRGVFVRSFVCSFVTLASFSSLWPAFTLTVHINALYKESVHRREEHAT